jgi:hypothetical protein
VFDRPKMQELGLAGGHIAFSDAVMRYTTGCMKRERERLARIFIVEKPPAKLAEAILDASLNDKVFKWNGPEAPLDAPPKSHAERVKKKGEGAAQ